MKGAFCAAWESELCFYTSTNISWMECRLVIVYDFQKCWTNKHLLGRMTGPSHSCVCVCVGMLSLWPRASLCDSLHKEKEEAFLSTAGGHRGRRNPDLHFSGTPLLPSPTSGKMIWLSGKWKKVGGAGGKTIIGVFRLSECSRPLSEPFGSVLIFREMSQVF